MLQAAALLLALLLLSDPALAYVRSTTRETLVPLSWRGKNCIRLRPDRSPTNHVQDGTEEEVIRRSARAWEAASSCSYMRLVVEEPALLPVPRPDNQLRDDVAILWIGEDWERLTGGTSETVALTQIRYVDNPGDAADGEILDADLQVNAQHYRFTIAGRPGTVNALTTVTHELGHVLGLDHPCSDGAPAQAILQSQAPSCVLGDFRDEVMYPSTALGAARPRVPSADETGGVCDIYPLAADPGACPSPGGSDGGCELAGAAPPPAGSAFLLLLGALVAVALRRRP